VADPQSADTQLQLEQPYGNHNGGGMQTGPDGHLYIGMGDGGAAGDPRCSAQRKDSLLGKMLRLDVRQNLDAPPYYGIPANNPFIADPEMRDVVWALGLRNPWRFSFDAAELTAPIHEYENGGRRGECSVTGGYVYRGPDAPELVGQYIFGDFCSAKVRALRETSPGSFEEVPLFDAESTLSSFGEDADGGLYLLLGNDVSRLVSADPAPAPSPTPAGD